MAVTAKLYLSERERRAKDAILQVFTNYFDAKIAGVLTEPATAEDLDQDLDRVIQFLMTAARLPLEERLTAQQQQIEELKAAVEALKSAA